MRMSKPLFRVVLCVCAALILVVAVHAQETVEDAFPQIETIPCPMSLPPGDVDGETFTCGIVRVPENWDEPGTRMLSIQFAIAHSPSLSTFTDPVIYLDGGPGGSSLEAIEGLSHYFEKLRETRDVIFFDQRGTQYSAPLDCPLQVYLGMTPEEAARALSAQTEATPEPEAADDTSSVISLSSNPDEVVDLARGTGFFDYFTRCGDYFRALGTDLSQYDTPNNARDTIALMNALGYDTYNLYGISYGSRLAQAVMQYYADHPDDSELPAIRSVVIDGILPQSYNQVTDSGDIRALVGLRVFADCQADPDCGAAFPNIRQRAIDLLVQLEESSITTSSGDEVTLDQVTQVMTTLDDKPQYVAYLPLMVDQLEQGDNTVLAGLLDGTLPPEPEEIINPGNPLEAITEQVDALAQETARLAGELYDVARLSERLSVALETDIPLPDLFLNEAERLRRNTPSFLVPLGLPLIQQAAFADPSRETIDTFISLYDDAYAKAILTSILNLMDDEDIAQTALLLTTGLVQERLSQPIQTYMNAAFICNDVYGNLDLQATWERLRGEEATQLINASQSELGFAVSYTLRCGNLGITPDARPLSDPVVSGIRTLVVNGSVDATTPKEWGDVVFASLSNAITTTIPLAGHGASAKSQCGQHIVRAFFTYPDGELDTSCTESLQPQWVLELSSSAEGEE